MRGGIILQDLDSGSSSPTLTQAPGFSVRCHDISEMCRSPSTPPMSTNAPKLVMLVTVPETVWPSAKDGDRHFPLSRALFFQELAARHHNIRFGAVHLRDDDRHFFLNPGIDIVARAKVQLRTGKKGVHADVGHIAALHFFDDRGFHGRLPLNAAKSVSQADISRAARQEMR